MKIKTAYYPALVDQETAKAMYSYLKDNIKWDEGVRSFRVKANNGHTRSAKMMDLSDDPNIEGLVLDVFNKIGMKDLITMGIYLNYYVDGDDWCPSHNHKGMCQVVISLGTTRTFIIGKKSYKMSTGDVIVFGSSMHSIPKEPEVKDGRIAIATFSKMIE